MHELSLIKDLMRKIEWIAEENNAKKISSVTLRLGALAHISAAHLREHFAVAVRGTNLEETRLNIDVSTDEAEPNAQDILLASVEVEV